ncbi:formate dehydrogenase subunit gamma [Dankookia sp. GCM10030260]|uniref:formate dehydrogenase subunit gamma n=1 Tax=Dankookia sp. GCM10030260 TaxID=3273390 RepID=UPI003612B720
MTGFPAAALAIALSLSGGSTMAQPAAGAPEVQSAAPEVGAGRGGTNNSQQPTSTEQSSDTGQERSPAPQGVAPRPAVPVEPIVPAPPFASRGRPDAAEVEQEMARQLGVLRGTVTIPNQSAGILIQPVGRDWRTWRTTVLTIAGAVVVLGTVALLAGLFLWKGPTPIESGRSGRSMARYNWLERFNHWMVASSFIILALTGLNITFGVYVLRPVIGPEAFTAVTWWGQAAHQYVSFAFVVGLAGMLAAWARDNWPRRVDVAWVKAGGPLAKGHPPAGRFNAAQKALFWFQVGGGALVAVSGYLLMAPALLDNITDQQLAHLVHGVMAMLLIAVILGHIYVGTIGTEGAFETMSTGRVDVNYAREHHSAWVDEQQAAARRLAAGD